MSSFITWSCAGLKPSGDLVPRRSGRRAPHVHPQSMLSVACLLSFCPFFVSFAPNDSRSVTFRQSAPSGGLNLNLKTSAREFTGSPSSPVLFNNISNDYNVLCLQAKRAVQRGATAVIFDVSENPDAIDQVCTLLKVTQTPLQQHWSCRSV